MKSEEDGINNDLQEENESSDVFNTEENNSESLYAIYDIQTSSNITVVSTNLASNTEEKLKQVLLEKLKKSNDEPSASNSGMFRLNMESGLLSCYYHLLAPSALLSSDLKASEFVHVAPHNGLLVVLASSWEGLFELFSLEVEKLLSSFQTCIDKKQLVEDLQSWYAVCVEYTTRTIKALSTKDLSTVLEVALELGELVIQDVTEPLASDLKRFVECCSFNYLDSSPRDRAVLAVYNDGTFTTAPDLTPLSQSWAQDLLASDIPVKVRQTIEWYKLKGIQDLNSLKRHIKKAVNDYYELYEAHQFLLKTGYPQVLLEHVSRENDVTNDDEDILKLLKDHLSTVAQ